MTLMRPSGRRLGGRSGDDRGTFDIGARPDGVTRCGRTAQDGVDQWGEAATSASAHRIRPGQSDSEQGVGSDHPLNVERGIGAHEM
jgi:hypothetical protein